MNGHVKNDEQPLLDDDMSCYPLARRKLAVAEIAVHRFLISRLLRTLELRGFTFFRPDETNGP